MNISDLRSFASAVDMPLLLIASDGDVLLVNRSFEQEFGWQASEVEGGPVRDLFASAGELERIVAAVGGLRVGEGIRLELNMNTSRGRSFDLSLQVAAWEPPGEGQQPCFLVTARDIRHERQQHRQMLELQRREMIGSVASGIATRLAELLGRLEPEAAERFRDVDEPWLENLSKASELVRQIQTFTRRRDVEAVPVEVSPILRQSVRFIESVAPADVKVEARLQDLPELVLGVPEELHQLLVNVMLNGVEAMQEGGGRLSISAQVVDGSVEESAQGMLPGVSSFRIRIADEGCGITPEDEAFVYEPFFTRKQERDATGMGLTVVRWLIRRYRGQIRFYSAPNQGTVFEILLPVYESDLPAKADLFGPRGVGQHLLLLDHETYVAQAGADLLREQGYRVSAFTSGEEAARALESLEESFDLAIIDMKMREGNGLDYLRELRKQGVRLPFILTTTLEFMPQPWETSEVGIQRVITKPCPARDLTSAIQSVLGAKDS